MIKSFNDLYQKLYLKAKFCQILKQQTLSSFFLIDVGTYLKIGPFSTKIGIVNLHSSRETHWVAYNNQNYFDSNGCSPPEKHYRLILKKDGLFLRSEYKIQGLDSFCANHCFYGNILTKLSGLDLNLLF